MTIKLKNVKKSGGPVVFRTGGANAIIDLSSPNWTTSAGELTAIEQNSILDISVLATSPTAIPVTYSITHGSLPDGVTLNSSTGAITGTLISYQSTKTFIFTITADNGLQASRNFSIKVKNSIPVWSVPAQSAMNGVFYSIYALTDGSTTYETSLNNGPGPRILAIDPNNDILTYTLISGTLPPSLTLNPNGVFTGYITPVTTNTTYTFTIRATNNHNFSTTDLTTSIQILKDETTLPVWTTPSGGPGTINLGSYASGATFTPVTLTATGWPESVPTGSRTMDYSDPTNSLGMIYGFDSNSVPVYFKLTATSALIGSLSSSNNKVPPLRPGTYTFNLTADNNYGGYTTQSFSITITA
jgi:hypothetical protein